MNRWYSCQRLASGFLGICYQSLSSIQQHYSKKAAIWVIVALLMGAWATTVLHADVSGVSLGGAADFAVLSTYDDVEVNKG